MEWHLLKDSGAEFRSRPASERIFRESPKVDRIRRLLLRPLSVSEEACSHSYSSTIDSSFKVCSNLLRSTGFTKK